MHTIRNYIRTMTGAKFMAAYVAVYAVVMTATQVSCRAAGLPRGVKVAAYTFLMLTAILAYDEVEHRARR